MEKTMHALNKRELAYQELVARANNESPEWRNDVNFLQVLITAANLLDILPEDALISLDIDNNGIKFKQLNEETYVIFFGWNGINSNDGSIIPVYICIGMDRIKAIQLPDGEFLDESNYSSLISYATTKGNHDLDFNPIEWPDSLLEWWETKAKENNGI